MNKTKIEWADMTWNPITGCLAGCEYCYARSIARRFGGYNRMKGRFVPTAYGNITKLNEPAMKGDKIAPYPYGFSPTKTASSL